jgi:hypothetical protein
MVALICFVLAVLASPFKLKSRLEAENAALRHQLIVAHSAGRASSRYEPKARSEYSAMKAVIQMVRLTSDLGLVPGTDLQVHTCANGVPSGM